MVWYKMTVKDYKGSYENPEFYFDNDSEALNFVNLFNTTMDTVKIELCTKVIFNNQKLRKIGEKRSFKVMYKDGHNAVNCTLWADNETKLAKVLQTQGFVIRSCLESKKLIL